jgi:glycosyltransferase involved in cell wall biosynthesis
MRNVIILSSLIHPLDYQQWLRRGENINPSHQQYMYRLAMAFQVQNDVTVLSLPPLLRTTKKLKIHRSVHRQKNLFFLQLSFFNHRILRPLSLRLQINRYLNRHIKRITEPLLLVVDGNSALAGWIAKRWRNHPQVETIGVLTDDPRQLSKIKPSHIQRFIRLNKHFDRYLSLTLPLLTFLHVEKKPNLMIPGIVEDLPGASQYSRPYFFFSGALYARYGIEALIQGFLDLNNPNLDLIIAGYGPEASYVEHMIQQHKQIKFLGLLDPKEAMKYQSGAYANINPRPLDDALDQVAIPSKVLDYISCGVPTISTEHPFIKKIFGEQCHWITESTPAGIRVALERFLTGDYAMHQSKALAAKKLALQNFGIQKIAQDLSEFTSDIK